MMKACVIEKYGTPEQFNIAEVQRPVPKTGEILVRVKATTVTGSDLMMRKGKPYIGRLYLGLRKPKMPILGYDFAGEVVETGPDVRNFQAGDRVFGGTTTLGCYAEYLVVKADNVVARLPENMSFEEGAPVSGSGVTVMNFLKGLGKLQAGDKVLINGASGSLGTFAVQIARHMGAEVTAVCSTAKLDLMRELGAQHVIDYTREDFTEGTEQYQIIFDMVGNRPFRQVKKAMSERGLYLFAAGSPRLFGAMLCSSLFGKKKARFSATGMLKVEKKKAYFLELKKLLEEGYIRTVVDRSYPIEQMAKAHAYAEKGHKKGNLIVTV